MDKEADEPERAGLHLARNLVSLRHARTLTQDALAAASGLPRSTIANLESGEANPSLAVLVKVASTLGVPIDELLAAPRAKVRKWTAEEIGSRQRGRGVAERPLVPEPTPEGLLYVMDFRPDARLGGTRTCREPASTSPVSTAGLRSSSPAITTCWTPGMCSPFPATRRIPT